jgi:hypothetical protein
MKNDKKKKKQSMWKKKSNITQINRAFVQVQNKFYSAQREFNNILLVIFLIDTKKKQIHDPSKIKIIYLFYLYIFIKFLMQVHMTIMAIIYFHVKNNF